MSISPCSGFAINEFQVRKLLHLLLTKEVSTLAGMEVSTLRGVRLHPVHESWFSGTFQEVSDRGYANRMEGRIVLSQERIRALVLLQPRVLLHEYQFRFHVYIVRGANVYMVCRNKERGEAALSKIQSTTGSKNIYLEICDLSSISEVKSFASRFCSEKKQLHVLVNNAGLLEHNRTTTPEGLELNFAVNVAATYVMTELMLPLLEKAAPDSRVITVSSGGMYTVPLTRDLQYSERNFDGVKQYARNKRLQVALTEKWAQIYHDKGVGFYSMHPGWAETPGVAKSLPSFHEKFSGKLRSSEEGADTIVWLALQPKEKLVSGAFYFDRFEAPKHLPFAGTAGSHSAIDAILDDLKSTWDSFCFISCSFLTTPGYVVRFVMSFMWTRVLYFSHFLPVFCLSKTGPRTQIGELSHLLDFFFFFF
ncbi:hypothetical protein HPP92_021417 [Vanilla planifolia]|uniref:Dehydrogenase/reductase SDR family member 12 n=1 Tax=Vanilla planifolia TaxID=51239 RepID=A0A835UKQ1_VANPL|nr:hypothetical protein HPP92_021417 [Vanilla planifolia]